MRHTLSRFAAALAVTTTLATAHAAETFQDLLVQPPSIGQPQRGSIAGSLSRLSFGAADLARGAYSLPLPIETPAQRGGLLASVFPGYSAENELGEWGAGWSSGLTITRIRIIGEVKFDDSDDFATPWGRVVRGDDGAYYPAGLRSKLRLTRTADGGWRAQTGDGTIYSFAAADATTTAAGTYAWQLSRVDSAFGDRTLLTWFANASGRRFLKKVSWGGRADGTQYEAELVNEALARPFASYASGTKLLLDQRVKQVVVRTKNAAGALVERWRYDLGYTTSPLGPAFYLTSLKRTFASGQVEPPVTYDYDLGVEQLAGARLQPEPALDLFLTATGGRGLAPDHAAMTDMEQNGLTDLEHHFAQMLVRHTDTGYVLEELGPAPAGVNLACRPPASIDNRPRLLARMKPGVQEPQVVVVRANTGGASSQITVCDRLGSTLGTSTVLLNWALGANTRLADVDLDQRPDLVRVFAGGVQVLSNTSTDTTWSFQPRPSQSIFPSFTPSATWVLDVNGDGKPDLMARSAASVVVWYGTGNQKFDSVGRTMTFRTSSGVVLSSLANLQFSHGDFNGDGLSDVLLSRGQQVFVYLNQGDGFQQKTVPGLDSIPFSFSYPVFADLTGSGNPELVFVENSKARTIALATPSTGLLRRSDDGKGTVIELGYARVKPEPGIIQRYALLARLTVTTAGRGSMSYGYEYGKPVWHTLGRFLVGFAAATRSSATSIERVEFENDDDVSGLAVGSTRRDPLHAPGLEKFSANRFEAASFHGVRFKRQVAAEGGFRSLFDAAQAPLSTRIDFEGYERGTCALRTSTTLPDAVLVKEQTLAHVAELPDELHCLEASQRLTGLHADASLDFDLNVRLERDAHGQIVRAVQDGPEGPLVLQEQRYGADGRMASSAKPGAGATRFGYDALGRLTEVVAADGKVIRVAGFDPLTDAIGELREEHGAGGVASYGFAYDGQERLARSWDSFSGSSASAPGRSYGYTFAGAGRPGRIASHTLVDAANGAARDQVDLQGGDGETLAIASWAGTWSFADLRRVDAATGTTQGYYRAPLVGADALAGLTLDQLYGAGAEATSRRVDASLGFTSEQAVVQQQGVSGGSATTWFLRGDELIERTIEDGGFVREVARDSGGRVIRQVDEAGVAQRYRHDALGRLVTVTLADGTHEVRFDGYGRPARVFRAGVQAIEYAYDRATGLPGERRVRDAAGVLERRTVTSYDAAGRPILVQHLGREGARRDFSFDYDGVGAGANGGRAAGQVGMRSRVRGERYERRDLFDAAERLVSSAVRLADGWREVTRRLVYRADGQVAATSFSVQDAAGATLFATTVATQVDGFGRVVRGLVDGRVLYDLRYDAHGRVERAELGDGHVLSFEYDPITGARRGYTLRGAGPDGRVAWTLDARGNVVSEELGDGRLRHHSYDARGWLSSSDGAGTTASYAYDDAGRPTWGGETTSYAWDTLGRVVRKGELELSYGPDGELELARKGARELRYFHDETGNRVLKLEAGVPVRAWVAGGLLTPTRFILPVEIDGILVGVLDNGVFQALLTDRHGTALGDQLASPFGARAQRGPLAEVVDFTRLGYDPDLGTVRMGARDYDADLARFWTPDPLFLENPAKCKDSPVECNLYGYARNNPLRFVDPTGTDARDGNWNVSLMDVKLQIDPGIFLSEYPVQMNTIEEDMDSWTGGFDLAPEAKEALHPILEDQYGIDLDEVEIHFGPTNGNAAFTLGSTIILDESYWNSMGPIDQLGLLAHELTHTAQYADLGKAEFLSRYVPEWSQGASNYQVPTTLQSIPISAVDPSDSLYTLDQLAERTRTAVVNQHNAGTINMCE